MTHATMLNLGTFTLAIPGAVASTADQIQKFKKRLAKRRGRSPKPTFSDSHPGWSGALTLSMLLALAGGFWMVFRSSPASLTAAKAPILESIAPLAPSPATQPTRPPKSLGGPPIQPRSAIRPSAPSVTPPPAPITITGGVKQGGDGECQQNVIGGNGNTQNCVLPPFSVSNEQANVIASHLKAANLPGQREVVVDYEFSAIGGAEAARNLVAAFSEGGVKAELGSGAVMIGTCNHDFIAPGLSVDCITPDDQPFLDALAEAFVTTNLASPQNPIEARRAPPGWTGPLIFVIRKR